MSCWHCFVNSCFQGQETDVSLIRFSHLSFVMSSCSIQWKSTQEKISKKFHPVKPLMQHKSLNFKHTQQYFWQSCWKNHTRRPDVAQISQVGEKYPSISSHSQQPWHHHKASAFSQKGIYLNPKPSKMQSIACNALFWFFLLPFCSPLTS